MAEYVSASELRPYKELFDKIFLQVQIEAKKSGLTFTHHLVGSAKRNMVIRHHNKGFDCDYQLFLQKNRQNLSPKEIKELLMELFDKYLPDNFDRCENSTSSITVSMVNTKASRVEFSYDIVILQNVGAVPEILRVVKKGNSLHYQWNQLPDMKGFVERVKRIQGMKMWNDLRARYYKKKTEQNGDHKKKSFQLFHEAVNETIQKFHK
jgi:hypothetical protein